MQGERGSKVENSKRAGRRLDWSSPLEPGAFYRWVFKPARGRAGLPPGIRLHDLRHTYASVALSRGASPYWLSEQMGHSSYRITLDVYAHWILKDDQHPLNGRPATAPALASPAPAVPAVVSLGERAPPDNTHQHLA